MRPLSAIEPISYSVSFSPGDVLRRSEVTSFFRTALVILFLSSTWFEIVYVFWMLNSFLSGKKEDFSWWFLTSAFDIICLGCLIEMLSLELSCVLSSMLSPVFLLLKKLYLLCIPHSLLGVAWQLVSSTCHLSMLDIRDCTPLLSSTTWLVLALPSTYSTSTCYNLLCGNSIFSTELCKLDDTIEYGLLLFMFFIWLFDDFWLTM